MPAVVAHFRFGQGILPYLNDEIKKIIKDNARLFGLGLQGPDLLFHSNVFKPDETALLGYEIHKNSASDFFGALLSSGRLGYSKYLAYVLGVCCHYSLDIACHPYIEQSDDGSYKYHNNLESDLDLAIILRDRLNKDRNVYLPRTVDYNIVASVYGISARNVKTCLDNFHLNTRLLDKVSLVSFAENRINKPGKWSAFSMKKEIIYQRQTAELLRIFDEATAPAVKLLTEFYHSTMEDQSLPTGFEMDFGGGYNV